VRFVFSISCLLLPIYNAPGRITMNSGDSVLRAAAQDADRYRTLQRPISVLKSTFIVPYPLELLGRGCDAFGGVLA
jgi:hypothetical protein